jgi:hypothetical protein
LVSQDAIEQFTLDSQKGADQDGMRKADAVANALFEDFNGDLLAKMIDELNLADLAESANNFDAAYKHMLRAEIYKAVLGITK